MDLPCKDYEKMFTKQYLYYLNEPRFSIEINHRYEVNKSSYNLSNRFIIK